MATTPRWDDPYFGCSEIAHRAECLLLPREEPLCHVPCRRAAELHRLVPWGGVAVAIHQAVGGADAQRERYFFLVPSSSATRQGRSSTVPEVFHIAELLGQRDGKLVGTSGTSAHTTMAPPIWTTRSHRIYRRASGKLLWFVPVCPHLTYFSKELSRSLQPRTFDDDAKLKHAIRYIKGTDDYRLAIRSETMISSGAIFDLGHAGHLIHRQRQRASARATPRRRDPVEAPAESGGRGEWGNGTAIGTGPDGRKKPGRRRVRRGPLARQSIRIRVWPGRDPSRRRMSPPSK